MKPVQYFSGEYLEQCRMMTSDDIIRFLEDFRLLHGHKPAPSKLISMKVPQDLLDAFRAKAKMNNTPYQTQIKQLMRSWVVGEH
jgi:uncharacterized protein (DUF4415 family)